MSSSSSPSASAGAAAAASQQHAALYKGMMAKASEDPVTDNLLSDIGRAIAAGQELGVQGGEGDDPKAETLSADELERRKDEAHRTMWGSAQLLIKHQQGSSTSSSSSSGSATSAAEMSRGEVERRQQEGFRNLRKWAESGARMAGIPAARKQESLDLSSIEFGVSAVGTAASTATESSEVASAVDAGFGLWATKDLRKDDVYLMVPRELMMTETSALETLGEWAKQRQAIRQVPTSLLALHLVHQKLILKSPWAPYIRMLPTTFDLALSWSPDEIGALPPGFLRDAARRLIRQAIMQYMYLRTELLKSESAPLSGTKFTLGDWMWAMSVVMSRQNQIPVLGDHHGDVEAQRARPKSELSLIPIWDLSNHKNTGTMTSGYNEASDSIVATVDEDMPRGSEICMFYGFRANYELLLWQGFTVDGNPNDRYRIAIPLTGGHGGAEGSVGLARAKAALLARHGVDARQLEIPINVHEPGEKPGTVQEHGVFLTIRAVSRIAVMTLEELKEHGLTTAAVLPPQLEGGSAADIEERALKLLRGIINNELERVSPYARDELPESAPGVDNSARREAARSIAKCAETILQRALMALDMKVVAPVKPAPHVPVRREITAAPVGGAGGGTGRKQGKKKGGKGRKRR